jgi:glycosyltransferase involved in cell wall biosynthesis
VQFHTDFLPGAQSLSLLSDCDLIVLPYRPSSEASSAALRTALSASVPVAVSRIALFDEADRAVLRVRAENADALAEDLESLLRDAALRQEAQKNAQDWMQARAWQRIARRLGGLLEGIFRSRS